MLAEVAGPDQRATKKMRPGHCTKKIHPRSWVSWVDLSRDQYIALPKLATPAGNTFAWWVLFTWDKRDSPKQTICSSARVKMRKKETCKRWYFHFAIFLTLEKFQFSKRKSLIDHNDSNNINNNHQFYRLAKHQLGTCIIPSHLIWLFDILKKHDARAFFLILTRALEHVVCLGESCFSQVNNSHRANVFPAGVVNFGKAIYWIFTPYKHCDFTGRVLWYYYRAWVTCVHIQLYVLKDKFPLWVLFLPVAQRFSSRLFERV